MSGNSEKSKTLLIPSDFEKLSGQLNYTRWKLHVIDLLQHHDEWDIANNAPKLSIAALQLLSLTVEYTVKDSYLENVARPLTSVSMWNALKDSLEPNSMLLKTQLLTEIVNFSLELNSDAEESLLKLTKLMSSFNLLTSDGFSGSELCLMLLYTKLPNELLSVRSTLMKNSNTTFDSAKVSVLQELRLFKAQESSAATGFLSQAKSCNKHKFKGRSYPVSKCWGCNPHLRPLCTECKQAGEKEFYHVSGSSKCQQNKTVKVYSCLSDKVNWYLDSGCSQHMSGASWPNTTLKPTSVSVTTANGTFKAHGVGSIMMGNLEITDALFCPASVPNLLSVSRLAERNYITIFDSSGSITIPRSAQIDDFINQFKSQSILNSIQENGLYKLSLGNSTTAFLSKSWEEAHELFGHRNYHDLPRIAKLFNFSLSGEMPTLCEFCARGKLIRNNIPRVSQNNLSLPPGEIFEGDYQGPFSLTSYDQTNGNIKFVDVGTKYIFMKCLKGKNSQDVSNFFSKIYHQLHTQFNISVKIVRTDDGSELKGYLDRFLTDKGILHQAGDAYKHHQPGCAERSHRSILENARTILLASKLPEIFYSAALEYSVYILNRIPRTGQIKSPFELLFGTPPSLKDLIPFGCVVYAHEPLERRKSKLKPSGIRCRFLGYANAHSDNVIHKGIKLLREDTLKIIYSSDYKLDLTAERTPIPDTSLTNNISQPLVLDVSFSNSEPINFPSNSSSVVSSPSTSSSVTSAPLPASHQIPLKVMLFLYWQKLLNQVLIWRESLMIIYQIIIIKPCYLTSP